MSSPFTGTLLPTSFTRCLWSRRIYIFNVLRYCKPGNLYSATMSAQGEDIRGDTTQTRKSQGTGLRFNPPLGPKYLRLTAGGACLKLKGESRALPCSLRMLVFLNEGEKIHLQSCRLHDTPTLQLTPPSDILTRTSHSSCLNLTM